MAKPTTSRKPTGNPPGRPSHPRLQTEAMQAMVPLIAAQNTLLTNILRTLQAPICRQCGAGDARPGNPPLCVACYIARHG